MLILDRGENESIRIGDAIRVTLLSADHGRVRIGLEVPPGTPIWRDDDGQDVPADPPIVLENTLRILLVEDDRVHARLIEKALGHAGAVEIQAVGDGETAMTFLQRVAGDPERSPHLVLLDLRLPGMSGLDVLRSLKTDANLRLIPVVMLSCSDDDGDISSCLDAGANAFVTKVHDYDELRRSIVRIASFWRHTQQVRR